MDILSINGLSKSFGDKKVLAGVDLSVPEHSVFGFIGRNGAGKTTTMRSVLGLVRTDGGEIRVCGEKVVYGQTPTNRYVGYLPDVPEFYPFMNAEEYLKLCGESLRMSGDVIKKRSGELLELVGLSGEKHRIKGFSRGMKQRLGIAQALIGSPKLLICDEPTSALDPIGRKEILDILLNVREQTTVLFSTHILSDIERICTDIAFLEGGRISMCGSAAEIKRIGDTKEFFVETLSDSDATLLAESFDGARLSAERQVTFVGEEDRMFEVLSFISQKKLSVTKVERQETSLESVFLEVASK